MEEADFAEKLAAAWNNNPEGSRLSICSHVKNKSCFHLFSISPHHLVFVLLGATVLSESPPLLNTDTL
jgi:hypothetical protein